MKTQKEIFLSTEGDQYFKRNKGLLENARDESGTIIHTLKEIEIIPKTVLEIGCSNGVKLHQFYKAFGSQCFGIDPSAEAIQEGKNAFPDITLKVGTADSLPFPDNKFDVIFFGFCLYLCDRKDLFKIAFEADRCLSDNGFLIIMDFSPPFPYKNTYAPKEGLFSYKMDYTKLFTWNPAYNNIFTTVFTHSAYSKRNIPDEKVAVSILNKVQGSAYPTEPYKE